MEWLGARRSEIEGTVLSLVVDPAVGEADHHAGLRDSVSVALDYALAGIERGEEVGPVPAALLARAREDARDGIGLDSVLRRYIAGYALLGDYAIQAFEKQAVPFEADGLRRVLRIQATLLDRLTAAVAEEYTLETKRRVRSTAERRLERVKTLLAGKFIETVELHYEFDGWHIGAIAEGPDAPAVLQGLAEKLDRRLLIVQPRAGTVWAWLGGRHRVGAEEASLYAPAPWPPGLSLALGEPERGLGRLAPHPSSGPSRPADRAASAAAHDSLRQRRLARLRSSR